MCSGQISARKSSKRSWKCSTKASGISSSVAPCPRRTSCAMQAGTFAGHRSLSIASKSLRIKKSNTWRRYTLRVAIRYWNEEFVDTVKERVPDRYRHAMRYFGLLAPRFKDRTSAALFALLKQERRPRSPRLSWANSLRRHFGIDPLIDSLGQPMYLDRKSTRLNSSHQ